MSKDNLERFRAELERMREAMLSKISDANAAIHGFAESAGADDADHVAASHHGATHAELIAVYRGELAYIEAALSKLDSGSYGVCEECGDDISLERLSAKPHAKFCLECREIFEAQNILRQKKEQQRGADS